MSTIELTPEVVFERTDGASPNPSYWNATSPRPKAKPTTQGRGYHSLGSATLPTRGRRGSGADSEYGVMISIKDIKGNPFVVLEDKDKQKHMVHAPDNESSLPSPPVSPDHLNGYTAEPNFKDIRNSSDTQPTLSVLSGLKRQATPSPVPRSRPLGSGREFGRPRSKITNDAKARSRSLPPGRAAQERKENRARSVSPSRRDRTQRQVDSERIKPVSNLIGLFETGTEIPNYSTMPKLTKINLLGHGPGTSRIREAANKMKAERMLSPTSTVSSSTISSSVDISNASSHKTNFTLTTVDSPTKAGQKPEGTYFALTSPGFMSGKGTFTLPRMNNVPKMPDYSTLSAKKIMPVASPQMKKNTAKRPQAAKTTPSFTRRQDNKKSFDTDVKIAQKESPPQDKPVEETPIVPTHVSKVKFIGPSQMLLKKTRRKKNREARKISTALSESEYSESEFSDAESLKAGEDSFRDEDEDQETQKADGEVAQITVSVKEPAVVDVDTLTDEIAHRRTPSIKFEKIISEDVTKKANELDSSMLEMEKKRGDNLKVDLDMAEEKIKKLEKEIVELKKNLMDAESEIYLKNTENGLLKKEAASLKKNLKSALSSDEEDKESILSLQRKLKTLRREKNTLEDNITVLESQKTTLKSQLQDAKREREDGEIQIRAMKHEMENLKNRSGEQERDIEGVRKELARARRQSEAQVHDLELQLTRAEMKARDLKIENSALERRLYELKHEKMANENEDAYANEAMRQLEESKLRALKDLEVAHAEVDEKARALREADRKNNKLQEELRRMDLGMEEELKERETTLAEAHQLDQKIRNLTAQHQVANREIEMLKKESESANSKAKLSENKLDKLQNLIDENEAKIESLGRSNKALNKQLEEDSVSRLNLNRDLHKLDRENHKLKEEVTDLKKKLRQAEIELTASKDALDDARKELREASERAENERNKASALGSNAVDLEDEYNKVKSTLGQKELALKNAREAIAKIESQMNEYEGSHSKAEHEKTMIEADRDLAKREMERLKGEVETQTKRMGNANETIKDLQEKLSHDTKSSFDGIEKSSEMKKEIQRLQTAVDEKTQQVFAAEETIYRQKEVIEELSSIQESSEKSALSEMEKFMAETEKQFEEIKKELETKNEMIKKLETDKKDLEEELEQQNPGIDDDREKEEELVNLSQKLREEEKEKKVLVARVREAEDKLSNALNELDIERSRIQVVLEEQLKEKDETDDLNYTIQNLEDKLEREAKELSNIKSHHMKTEMKLRDVLEQAEDETDKGIREKEMLTVRAEALERQVEEAERVAEQAENSKRDMERELQQQLEANYKLQQTLAALGIGQSSSASEGQGSMLTSV